MIWCFCLKSKYWLTVQDALLLFACGFIIYEHRLTNTTIYICIRWLVARRLHCNQGNSFQQFVALIWLNLTTVGVGMNFRFSYSTLGSPYFFDLEQQLCSHLIQSVVQGWFCYFTQFTLFIFYKQQPFDLK